MGQRARVCRGVARWAVCRPRWQAVFRWYGSRLRTPRDSNDAPGAGDAARQASRRAVVFILPALLLSIVAIMMLEQSLRWAATAAVRRHFTKTEFQIDHLRDEPGKGGFALDGHIVSSGEVIHTTESHAVSLERLRELDAAGRIPVACDTVHTSGPCTRGIPASDHPLSDAGAGHVRRRRAGLGWSSTCSLPLAPCGCSDVAFEWPGPMRPRHHLRRARAADHRNGWSLGYCNVKFDGCCHRHRNGNSILHRGRVAPLSNRVQRGLIQARPRTQYPLVSTTAPSASIVSSTMTTPAVRDARASSDKNGACVEHLPWRCDVASTCSGTLGAVGLGASPEPSRVVRRVGSDGD